jgi:hypothetical protein
MTDEKPAPDDADVQTVNTDDGTAGTLDKPRDADEGGDDVNDTIPDA